MDLRTFKSAQFRQRIGEPQQHKIGSGARVEPDIVIFRLHGGVIDRFETAALP